MVDRTAGGAPDASLSEVTEQMRQARLSCVVVVDGRRPVGVITERDLTGLCARLLAGDAAGSVADVMSDGVLTLDADASCADAVDTIQSRRIRRLVIVSVKCRARAGDRDTHPRRGLLELAAGHLAP